MKTSHTPGPWEVLTASTHPYAITAKDRRIVIWGGISKATQPESLANARLIAAAPELLETVKAFFRRMQDAEGSDAMYADVEALIAKVEGEDVS